MATTLIFVRKLTILKSNYRLNVSGQVTLLAEGSYRNEGIFLMCSPIISPLDCSIEDFKDHCHKANKIGS